MKRTKGSIEKGNREEKLFGYRQSGFFLGLSLNPLLFLSFAVLIAAMCIGIVNQCGVSLKQLMTTLVPIHHKALTPKPVKN
jgi:hypothetical protein